MVKRRLPMLAVGRFAPFRLRAFSRSKSIARFDGWFAWQHAALPLGDDTANRWPYQESITFMEWIFK
jgi:hypothetical protein